MYKIINKDCLEALKEIPDNSVDCVVTSPPYNLKGLKGLKGLCHSYPAKWNGKYIQATYGLDYAGDDLTEEEYQSWQINVLNECQRVIKPTGSVFYNHKNRRVKGTTRSPLEFILKSSINFYQEIVWDRCSSHIPAVRKVGESTERIYWLTKTTKPNVYKPDDILWRTEVWRQMPVQGDKRPSHPAPFPIEIPTNCILLTTQPGDLVLDPFAGSFTTGCAAIQLGRDFIGIEISEQYCELGRRRIDLAARTAEVEHLYE